MKFKKSYLMLSLCLAPLVLNSCGETNNSIVAPSESEFETKTKEIYKKAVEAGFKGTYEEWLDTIVGEPGKDGKEIKEIKYTNSSDGFANYLVIFNDGTTTDLKIPINGPQGPAGQDGQDGKPGVDGQDGKPGVDGQDGSSVLSGSDDPQNSFGNIGDLYINLTTWDVFKKENSGWIKQGNIKGADGQDGQDGKPGTNGQDGQDGKPGIDGESGQNGNDGKSAYEIYKEAHPEYTKSETEWLDDLVNGRLGTKQKHTITFNTGCDVVVPSQQIEHGEKIVEPETPIREYYTFNHWEYKGQPWSFIGYTCTEDMQLDAVWNANCIKFTATIEYDNDAWHVGDPDRKITINLEDGDSTEVEKLYNSGLIKIVTNRPNLISINKFTVKALACGSGSITVVIGSNTYSFPFTITEQPLTISKAIELHQKDLNINLDKRPTFSAFGKIVAITHDDIILYDGNDFIVADNKISRNNMFNLGDVVELNFTKIQKHFDYYRYVTDVIVKSHKQVDTSKFNYSEIDHYQCRKMNQDGRNGIIGKPKLLSLNNLIVDSFDFNTKALICNYQCNTLIIPLQYNNSELIHAYDNGTILNVKVLTYDYYEMDLARGTHIAIIEEPTVVGNTNDVTCSLTLPEGVTASKTSNLKYDEEVTIYYNGQETLCLNFDDITLYKQFNPGEYTIRISLLGENRIYFRR